MKVTVMSIIVDVLETVPKGLEKRLRKLDIRKSVTIQTTTLLKSVKIL